MCLTDVEKLQKVFHNSFNFFDFAGEFSAYLV